MQIDYDKFLEELARRSKENYLYIKNNCEKEKLFEVIQLINSMYCMLVVPQEILGMKWNQSEGDTKTNYSTKEKNLKKYPVYHDIVKIIDDLKLSKRIKYLNEGRFERACPVCALIYHLRNALCHEGLGFFPIQTDYGGVVKNKITDVIFESKLSDKSKIVFIAVIDIERLEKLLLLIADMYSAVERGKSQAHKKDYCDFYKKLQDDVDEYLHDYK